MDNSRLNKNVISVWRWLVSMSSVKDIISLSTHFESNHTDGQSGWSRFALDKYHGNTLWAVEGSQHVQEFSCCALTLLITEPICHLMCTQSVQMESGLADDRCVTTDKRPKMRLKRTKYETGQWSNCIIMCL